MEGGQKIAIEKKFTPDIFGKKSVRILKIYQNKVAKYNTIFQL